MLLKSNLEDVILTCFKLFSRTKLRTLYTGLKLKLLSLLRMMVLILSRLLWASLLSRQSLSSSSLLILCCESWNWVK